MFYLNISTSKEIGESESFVMSSCIIVKDLLFDYVRGTKFSCVIPCVNVVRLDDFMVSLEGSKIVVDKPEIDLSCFVLLSLCFKHRILAQIIATNLLLRKVL